MNHITQLGLTGLLVTVVILGIFMYAIIRTNIYMNTEDEDERILREVKRIDNLKKVRTEEVI